MASYPPPQEPQSRVALRFLTLGAVIAALLLSVWWTNRLADHLERQRELLLQIQRDVLVNQAQVGNVLATAEQNNRRLAVVEGQAANAADDRGQMRRMDQEMLEAIVSLRAALGPTPPPPLPPRPRLHRE